MPIGPLCPFEVFARIRTALHHDTGHCDYLQRQQTIAQMERGIILSGYANALGTQDARLRSCASRFKSTSLFDLEESISSNNEKLSSMDQRWGDAQFSGMIRRYTDE